MSKIKKVSNVGNKTEFIKVPSDNDIKVRNLLNRYFQSPYDEDLQCVEGIIVECTDRVKKDISSYVSNQLNNIVLDGIKEVMPSIIQNLKVELVQDVVSLIMKSIKASIVSYSPIAPTNIVLIEDIDDNIKLEKDKDIVLVFVNSALQVEDVNFTFILDSERNIEKIDFIDEQIDNLDSITIVTLHNLGGDVLEF